MPRLLLATLILSLSLTACGVADVYNVGKEASEAVENLQNEALEIGENVNTKLEQIDNTAQAVSEAVDALQEAANNVRILTE